ncbi:BTAD domain-containing putative transcriptional regulator [Marinactinospora endophytica]
MRISLGRQQILLGALLLEQGRVVRVDRLIDMIWDEDPPDTARTQVQICVSRLRKALTDNGVKATILTRPPGYLLRVPEERVDVRLYERRISEAEALVRDGQTEKAALCFRKAVALWRGPALSGIKSRGLRAKGARLDESRLDTIESYIELELGLGRHHQLVGEISGLVHEHPFRERLRAQLMLALYRSGRRAKALETYRAGRELLARELGLEPGEELRRTEAAILAGDALFRPAEAVTLVTALEPTPEEPADPGGDEATFTVGTPPRQLPPDTADFVGRTEEIAEIEKALVEARPKQAVGVVVVVGKPGVGKSSLALHVAHRLAQERFPDGQLYFDLGGTRADPVEPADILVRFLRALGIPGPAIPARLDERAEMYRSLLAGRRILVLLDDAASERQISPLLPGSASCAVIVTSRCRLTGVPGARVVEPDVLGSQQSVRLLARVLGEERVAREPEAAATLVAAVGNLPLALRIIGARLAARPHWSLASMVRRLSDEHRWLDELSHGDMVMRASISLTYDGLGAQARRLLRLLGLVETADFPGWVAGALLGDGRPFPADLLDPLVDAQMLDVVDPELAGEPHYLFHSTIRMFVRERLGEGRDENDRVGAVERMVSGWLALVDQANRNIYGGDYLILRGEHPRWRPRGPQNGDLVDRPLKWLEERQDALCSAVHQAADLGLDELCWDLASSLVPLFERRGYLDQWEQTNCRAQQVVRNAGNRRGIAALAYSLASLHICRRQYSWAFPALTSALKEFDALGDPLGRAKCLRDLAFLWYVRGHNERALALSEQAFTEFRRIEDVPGQGRALVLSGHVHTRLGDFVQALLHLQRALECAEMTRDRRSQAQVLRRIGQTLMCRGEDRKAADVLREAYDLIKEDGDLIGEGYLLHDLGEVYMELGCPSEALRYLKRSLAIREQISDREGMNEVRAAIERLEGRPISHAWPG